MASAFSVIPLKNPIPRPLFVLPEILKALNNFTFEGSSTKVSSAETFADFEG